MKGREVASSQQASVFPLLSRKQEAMIGTTTSKIMSMLEGGPKAETYNGLVLWGLESLRHSVACHDFKCNGVVLTMITVFDTLVREFIVRWFLVSVQQVSRSKFAHR